MEISKKISNKLFADLAIGETVTIAGVCHSYSEAEGMYGAYKAFKGEFALLHKDNTIMSAAMFLPEIAADMLASMVIQGATAAGDSFKGIEFALELGKKADTDPRNARGFQWAVFPKIAATPATSRALALLGNAAPEAPKEVASDIETDHTVDAPDAPVNTDKGSKKGGK